MSYLLVNADVLSGLACLPDESVHMVVTSPPYWGLRSYLPEGHPLKRFEIGLEPTPEEYIAKMVAVFRELRRVLRSDGTLWVNMGDCFVSRPHGTKVPTHDPKWKSGRNRTVDRAGACNRGNSTGLKPKDLVGMPWRLAFALQSDGWYLRRDIIWNKSNPMPESVQDRPATSHEYVFLFSRSRRYFYDRVRVMEAVTGNAHSRGKGHGPKSRMNVNHDPEHARRPKLKQSHSFLSAVTGLVSMRNLRSVWSIATQSYTGAHYATYPEKLVRPCVLAGTSEKGCCPLCMAPFRRVVEKQFHGDWSASRELKDSGVNRTSTESKAKWVANTEERHMGTRLLANNMAARAAGGRHDNPFKAPRTIAWKLTCQCELDEAHINPARPIVLDPFCGSGTTGVVALRYGCDFIGIDLFHQYLKENARERIEHSLANPPKVRRIKSGPKQPEQLELLEASAS